MTRNSGLREAISDDNDRELWEVVRFTKSNNDLPNGMAVEEITDSFLINMKLISIILIIIA